VAALVLLLQKLRRQNKNLDRFWLALVTARSVLAGARNG
jgi:hypothetical protein